MKANTHKILEHCIDAGIELGWNRAHKHTDNPSPELLKSKIEQAIWDELYEWATFYDDTGRPV